MMLSEIRRMVADLHAAGLRLDPEVDKLMPVEETRDYIESKTGKKPATQTLYDLSCKRKIPFQKVGKYLMFRRSEIDEWLNSGYRIAVRA